MIFLEERIGQFRQEYFKVKEAENKHETDNLIEDDTNEQTSTCENRFLWRVFSLLRADGILYIHNALA